MPDTDHHFDFNLHGHVGVRVSGTRRGSASRLADRLGLSAGATDGGPDVRVDFVERIETRGALRELGSEGAGFDDESFYVVHRDGDRRALTKIDFDLIGEAGFVLTCERTIPSVPLARSIINLAAIARGLTPIHGSAFVDGGAGTVISGWSHSGKTGTLLTHMAHGARYLAADWVYLTPDGRLHAARDPVRLREWHLKALPEFAPYTPRRRRLGLGAAGLALGAYGRLRRNLKGSRATRLTDRLAAGLESRAHVDIPARRLFGDALAPNGTLLAGLILTVSHDADDVRVERAAAPEMSSRVTSIFEEASVDVVRQYARFRYAFPDRRSHTVEGAGEMLRARLSHLLEGIELRIVSHPYPVSADALLKAMQSEVMTP